MFNVYVLIAYKISIQTELFEDRQAKGCVFEMVWKLHVDFNMNYHQLY